MTENRPEGLGLGKPDSSPRAPANNTMGDTNLLYFGDQARRQAIHKKAIEHCGGNAFHERVVQDLGLKLTIAQNFLRLDRTYWYPKWIAHVVYGGLRPEDATSTLNPIIRGKKPLSATAASMLAQWVNYFLDVPDAGVARPEQTSSPEKEASLDRRSNEDIRSDRTRAIWEWIDAGAPMEGWMTAADFGGDLLSFTRKLGRLARNEGISDPSVNAEAAIHDRIVEALTEPMQVADWHRRLVIQPYRELPVERERTRFGAELSAGGDPRTWAAKEFNQGEAIEYGTPSAPTVPSRGWLVTIRDPRPSDPHGDRFSGKWIWEESWDNIIRWLEPFRLPSGTPVRAPTGSRNIVQPLPGLYRVFMFVEPEDARIVEDCLAQDKAESSSIPDASAYLGLTAVIVQLKEHPALTVHTGSYFVYPS